MTTWQVFLLCPQSCNQCFENTREAGHLLRRCRGFQVLGLEPGSTFQNASNVSHTLPGILIKKLPRGRGWSEGWFRKAKEER